MGPNTVPGRHGIFHKFSTERTIIAALFSLFIGIFLMYLTEREQFWKGFELWRPVLREIGAMFFTTVAVALLWELFGKRALIDEVFETAKISEAMKAAGLIEITPYAPSVDWAACFEGANRLDVLLGWNWSLLDLNQQYLDGFLSKQYTLNVLLPKPSTDDAAKSLTSKAEKTFSKPPYKGSNVKIQLASFSPKHSIYLFDHRAVLVLIKNGSDDPGPALVVREGILYEHIRKEF